MQYLSNSQMKQLISIVQANEILYNSEHPQHKMKYLKAKVWSDISAALDVPEDHARQAWRSLRDAFFRHNKKMKGSSGNATEHRKPYKYQNELSFLNKTLEPRKTRGSNELMEFLPNLSPARDPLASLPAATLSHPKSLPVIIPPSRLSSSPASSVNELESDESTLLTPLASPSAISFTFSNNNQKKKQRTEKVGNDAQKMLASLVNSLNEDEEDDVGLFFKGLAIKIRKLNLNMNEFMDLELCVINCIRKSLKEMGKI